MTNNQKHTPGPWYIKRVGNEINAGSWEILCQSDDSFVAQVYRINKIPHKEVEANARFIAAAPEMLEALRGCLASLIDYSEGRTPEATEESGYIFLAKQAIAKAEGRG